MSDFYFDASQIAPDTGSDPVPNGWYDAAIIKSELKPTKDTLGALFELQLKILNGQYAGKLITTRCNVKNVNPDAQRIGLAQMSAISHAVGVIQWNNSAMLHDKPMKIKVKVRKDPTGQYDDQNEITAFREPNFQPSVTTNPVVNNSPISNAGIAIPAQPVQLMPPAQTAISQPVMPPQAIPVMQPMAQPQYTPPPAPVAQPAAPQQPWPQPGTVVNTGMPQQQPIQQPVPQMQAMPQGMPPFDPAQFAAQQAAAQMPVQHVQQPVQQAAPQPLPEAVQNMLPPWMQAAQQQMAPQ